MVIEIPVALPSDFEAIQKLSLYFKFGDDACRLIL